MDPKAVGGEEGLAAALLVTDEGVLSAVGLLVGAQVACCAVGAGASLKGALVPLDLMEDMDTLSVEKQLSRSHLSTLGQGLMKHKLIANL